MELSKKRIKIGMTFFILGVISGVIFTATTERTKASLAMPPEFGESKIKFEQSVRNPFSYAIKQVEPAVINISAERTFRHPEIPIPRGFEEFFREFFRDIPRKSTSLGSGFIFMRRGDYHYILTNNHVIKDAEKIVIKLPDKSEFKGKDVEIVGGDERTDVAVLRIKSRRDLPIAPLGDSDSLEVGEWVIAIGNPFGLERTVTVGVVSAKGRSGLSLPEGPSYQDFIQTDAAINFGNSGGPLVNIEGKVVGINTAITTPSGGNIGIGFAIPINLAKHVAEQLIEKGRVVRGYLGIRPQEITEEIAKAYGLQKLTGVLVAEVLPNTPAEKAGLKEGDLIVEFNGQEVPNVDKFRIMVADLEPGTKVKLKVVKPDGKIRELTAVLTEFPREVKEARRTIRRQEGRIDKEESWLGMRVVDISSPRGRELLDDSEDKGVVVIEIEEDSKAFEAGIRVGDVIQKIGEFEISNIEDFAKARNRYSGSNKPIVIKLKRSGFSMFIGVSPN